MPREAASHRHTAGRRAPRAARVPGPIGLAPAAALVRAQADLQLEAFPARGARERPPSGAAGCFFRLGLWPKPLVRPGIYRGH